MIPIFLAQAGMEGCANTSFMVIAMLAVFYFVVLRPQAKEMQERQKFKDSLKVDDRVVTSGGLLGRITDMSGERVTLEIAPRVHVRVLKDKIETKQNSAESSSAENSGKNAAS